MTELERLREASHRLDEMVAAKIQEHGGSDVRKIVFDICCYLPAGLFCNDCEKLLINERLTELVEAAIARV